MSVMEKKRYFVFISYSSKDNEDDNKWAEWLRHELEHWHLPATYNGIKPQRDNLREVFRDRDGFSAGKDWWEQAKDKLKQSQNLIVICSPNAKNSPAVNKEVEYFINELNKGNDDNVYPFIVEGDKPIECFPEALRESKIGGDVNKDGGREDAFLKIVAGMLNVDFHDLRDRYQLEKIEEERIEREKKEKLQIAQSRFVAEKANDLINEGDSFLASFLSLNALPLSLKAPDRPYVMEAEAALRKSLRKENAILLGHKHSVISSIYSKDGNRIYSVSWDKRLCVWDAMSGSLVTFKKRHSGNINSVSQSDDGSALVTASDDKKAIIWDSKTFKLRTKPLVHDAPVRHALFSPCGKYLLTALNDGNVCIWDLRGQLIKTFKADDNSIINSVLVDRTNRIITASHGWDNEKTWCNVKIWKWDKDSNNVECCKLLSPRWPNVQNESGGLSTEWHSDNIGKFFPSLAYCCKRNLLLFASENHIFIWQLTDFKLLKILSFSSTITTFAINEDESIIAVATSGSNVFFQNIPEDDMSWEKPHSIDKFDFGITDLSFCHAKRHLLLVSFDIGIIRQIDLGVNPFFIKDTSILADSISFISNNRFVVASSRDEYLGTI